MKSLALAVSAAAVLTAAAPAALASPEDPVVGIAGANYAIPAARAQYEGVAAALKERGIRYRFLDALLDINKQVSQLDQFVNEGVDAIVVNVAGDPNAVLAPLNRAQAAGIKIFGLGPTPGFDDLLVQADNGAPEQGRRSGEFMCEALGGSGRIAMIKGIEIPTLAPRWDEFRAALQANCPDVEIMAEERAIPDDSATARPIAENLLTRFPDLDAIWAMNDGVALGTALAAKSAGRSDLIVTGINGEQYAAEGIKMGLIAASWDMEPVETGYKLGQMVADILQGEAEIPAETVVFEPTDVPMWTQDTIGDWKPYEARIPYPGLQ